MISAHLLRVAAAINAAHASEPVWVAELPTRLVNCTNQRGFWRKHASRVKAQRSAAAIAMRGSGLRHHLNGAFIVLITRVAPNRLDDDGAAASAKPVRDGIADALLVDDRDPRVTWLVDQRKAGVREYAAEVHVWRWTP